MPRRASDRARSIRATISRSDPACLWNAAISSRRALSSSNVSRTFSRTFTSKRSRRSACARSQQESHAKSAVRRHNTLPSLRFPSRAEAGQGVRAQPRLDGAKMTQGKSRFNTLSDAVGLSSLTRHAAEELGVAVQRYARYLRKHFEETVKLRRGDRRRGDGNRRGACGAHATLRTGHERQAVRRAK